MCLSLMRTGAGVTKYAGFNVLNRFQTYSNSIDCTCVRSQRLMFRFANFFFHNVACANFFLCPFGALQKFFFSNPSTPPPPPHEIN